jgi:hypothetical protein
MLSLVQNLRIGTKLAVMSAFGMLLVIAMIASQIVGNGNVRRSNQAAFAQQELARDAIEAKLWVRSMQLSARDFRLTNSVGELQKAGDARRALDVTGQRRGCDVQVVTCAGKPRADREAQEPLRRLS